MRLRTLFAWAFAVVAVAAGATAASGAERALVTCGKVTAADLSWQVGAAGVKCSTARSVVRRVAVKKPDHVIKARGGEIDQFKSSFSGMKCTRSRSAHVGSAIQCTSADGKRSVFGLHKG